MSENTPVLCKSCRKPKAPYECGLCHDHMCKSCTQFLTESFSAYRKPIPDYLRHSSYCMNCFDEKVAEPLHDYEDKMKRAEDIIIYSKDQTKLTRFLKRKADPYKVENCEDEQEALMKMSFYAVEDGYNCLIDIQYSTKKSVTGSHKKTIYSATAVPITIEPGSIRGHMDPP